MKTNILFLLTLFVAGVGCGASPKPQKPTSVAQVPASLGSIKIAWTEEEHQVVDELCDGLTNQVDQAFVSWKCPIACNSIESCVTAANHPALRQAKDDENQPSGVPCPPQPGNYPKTNCIQVLNTKQASVALQKYTCQGAALWSANVRRAKIAVRKEKPKDVQAYFDLLNKHMRRSLILEDALAQQRVVP